MKIEPKKTIKKSAYPVLIMGFVLFWFSFSLAEQGGLNRLEDQDGDGLSNMEEKTLGTDPTKEDTDGDGYSDGVEVKSGYDPLKPAPGDKIFFQKEDEINKTTTEKGEQATKEENLTEEFIKELKASKERELSIVSENLMSGDGEEEGLNNNSDVSLTEADIASLTQEALLSNQDDKMGLVPLEDLKIMKPVKEKNNRKKKEKEKNQIETYFSVLGFDFVNNAPLKIDESDPTDRIKAYFESLKYDVASGNQGEAQRVKKRMSKTLEEIKRIETPDVLKNFHQKVVSLLKYSVEQDETVVFQEGDPLALALLIGKTQAILQKELELEAEMKNVFKEYGIESTNEGKKTNKKENNDEEKKGETKNSSKKSNKGVEGNKEEEKK